MTPEQVKRLAQPLAELYEELTDELMEKIAEQLATHGTMTDTAKWQITKLAQAGRLNQETLRIIAQRAAVCPELTEQALRTAAYEAINTLEPQLQQAARLGLVGQAVGVPASARVTRVLQTYQAQAKDVYNLVNTVMAYKVRDAYTGLVNKTADIAGRIEYLSILGKNTASVITGQQARQTALRQCIREFSEKRLPGFVDRAGREWSPEAYINMDIRTTVARVATESQFARMDDYGADLISVSSHIGARPRCEPFQGRIYSRSGKSGFTEDLNGGHIPYAPWGSTSYGEAAGLLGINCGHQVYPFFPGLSRLAYQPYPKGENDRVYAQSQRQRYLERQVRTSKRECAMLDKLGDREGFDKAAQRLKQREQTLKQYMQETGHAKKVDRTQVWEYNKSTSSKAMASTKQNVSHSKKASTPTVTYKTFETGESVNDFFYYDGEERGLLARKRSAYGQWEKSLTEDQKSAINAYTTGGYADLNNFLRKLQDWQNLDADAMTAFRDDLRSSIAEFDLKEPIKVYRYTGKDTFGNESLENLIGRDWSDAGFMSTSPVMQGAKNAIITGKDYLLEIDVPSGKGVGAYLNKLSSWEDTEYEFLLKDNTKFKILDVVTTGDKPVIKMVVKT